MIRVTFDDARAAEYLLELQRRSGNLAPLFADIAETLLQSTRERFRAEIDPEGQPWADLDPVYQARKVRQGLDPGKLKATGVTRDTLLSDSGSDFAEVGSGRRQAAVHQFGSSDGTIPAREFLGLSLEDVTEVTESIVDYFENF